MTEASGQELVAVYRAADEAAANMAAGLLKSEGITAMLQTSSTTWGGQAAIADSLERRQVNYWGDVVVAPSDADRARELIGAFEPMEPAPVPRTSKWTQHYTHKSVRIPWIIFGCAFAVGAYLARIGDVLGFVSAMFTGSGCGLLYAVYMLTSKKYVPERFRAAHTQVGNGLVITSMIMGALWISASVQAGGLSRSVMLGWQAIICLICAGASVCAALRQLPGERG